tara:strand:+ start:1967 stop:2083 length:117 start_codon:yes stop_codon:yes gene_type:complete
MRLCRQDATYFSKTGLVQNEYQDRAMRESLELPKQLRK